MTKEIIMDVLRSETINCFSDQWYNHISEKLHSALVSKDELSGYVYFVRIAGTNKVKIGIAKNIMNRISSFKTVLTEKLLLDGYIYCQGYSLIEKEIHLLNKSKNITLEWFNLNREDVVDIISKYNGTNVFCKVNKSLIIEDGILLNESEKIKADVFELNSESEVYKIIESEIRKFFDKIKVTKFKATLTEIKNRVFPVNNEINRTKISLFLKSKGILAKAERYHPLGNEAYPLVVGRPYELKIEDFS